MNDFVTDFLSRHRDHTTTLGVIGMGYVGLPLALAFSKNGFTVIGFEVDQTKCDKLNTGRSYIRHIASEPIQESLKNKKFSATCDFSKIRETDAVIICVPTPLTAQREPDMSYILSSGQSIAPHLKSGHLVVLESTTYPGTTRDVLKPIIETHSKLKVGIDLFLAFSPEREDPANPKFSTTSIPKVVGGINPESLKMAEALYSPVIKNMVPVSSCEVAESAKLLENIYRSVNIALVNELKILFDKMGINVWEVIQAASTKPFGFTPFYPGPGLGGHCIPIDPFYLTWKAREYSVTTKFIELAGEVNSSMPQYVVQKIQDALNQNSRALKGSKILLAGLAYKKNVDDQRESPTIELFHSLKSKGAHIEFHDPHIETGLDGLHSTKWSENSLQKFDAVVIVTDHDAVDYTLLKNFRGAIIDTRNALASRGIQTNAVLA